MCEPHMWCGKIAARCGKMVQDGQVVREMGCARAPAGIYMSMSASMPVANPEAARPPRPAPEAVGKRTVPTRSELRQQ